MTVCGPHGRPEGKLSTISRNGEWDFHEFLQQLEIDNPIDNTKEWGEQIC